MLPLIIYMSMFAAFNISASGMTAQQLRTDVISQNIANANTIIIYNADRLGLSQIYQIRGQVGRSKNMASHYFFYQTHWQ